MDTKDNQLIAMAGQLTVKIYRNFILRVDVDFDEACAFQVLSYLLNEIRVRRSSRKLVDNRGG